MAPETALYFVLIEGPAQSVFGGARDSTLLPDRQAEAPVRRVIADAVLKERRSGNSHGCFGLVARAEDPGDGACGRFHTAIRLHPQRVVVQIVIQEKTASGFADRGRREGAKEFAVSWLLQAMRVGGGSVPGRLAWVTTRAILG